MPIIYKNKTILFQAYFWFKLFKKIIYVKGLCECNNLGQKCKYKNNPCPVKTSYPKAMCSRNAEEYN